MALSVNYLTLDFGSQSQGSRIEPHVGLGAWRGVWLRFSLSLPLPRGHAGERRKEKRKEEKRKRKAGQRVVNEQTQGVASPSHSGSPASDLCVDTEFILFLAPIHSTARREKSPKGPSSRSPRLGAQCGNVP